MTSVLLRPLVILIAFAPLLAAAQTTQPAATQPSRPSAEEMLRQMLRPTTQGAKPLQPVPDGGGGVIDVTTGTGAVAPGAPQLNLRNEGAIVVDQLGRLSKLPDGRWQITWEADGRAMQEPPMIVVPNRMLSRMQPVAAGPGFSPDVRFRITGEVTQYDGRNHILIQKASQVPDVLQPLK